MHRALDWPRHFGNGTLVRRGRTGGETVEKPSDHRTEVRTLGPTRVAVERASEVVLRGVGGGELQMREAQVAMKLCQRRIGPRTTAESHRFLE